MFKKTVTYVDFNGIEHTEDFFFNLNKAEVIKLELSYPGGFEQYLDTIVKANDGAAIMNAFNDIIMMSYGEKSEDGKRFVKSAELSDAFSQTPAYEQIFIELCTDNNAAAAFVNGVMPTLTDADKKKLDIAVKASSNAPATPTHPNFSVE